MGRILSIRLSAVTYTEEDVFKTWPNLCALAWPGKGEIVSGAWRPRTASFAPPVAAETVRHGVVELARDLLEESRFGDWDADVKNRLAPAMPELEKAGGALDAALENWQPQAANTASNDIEDALDKLEKLAV